MKIGQTLYISVALLSIANGPAIAEQRDTAPYTEIAESHCAEAWTSFEALAPGAWAELGSADIDPEIDTATTRAFNKFRAAAIALADYTGMFVGFATPENLNSEYFTLARAKYDLAMCLTPTLQERKLIIELAQSIIDAPDDEIRDKFFEGFDQFKCMQFDKASEAIFSLEPSNQNFSFDFEEITSANMRACR